MHPESIQNQLESHVNFIEITMQPTQNPLDFIAIFWTLAIAMILDTFGHVWTRKPKNIEKHNKKRNRCPKKAPFLSSCPPGQGDRGNQTGQTGETPPELTHSIIWRPRGAQSLCTISFGDPRAPRGYAQYHLEIQMPPELSHSIIWRPRCVHKKVLF